MTFQPVIPMNGAAGWAFLKRTQVAQQNAFNASSEIQRDTQYFLDNIGNVKTSEDLVSDRRLLGVALGAYGLEDDINNTYFIKKVLDDGTFDTEDLPNRLSDKRYLAFSKGFGFGDFDTPRTQLSTFGTDLVSAYKDKKFEVAVGRQDQDMRLALTLENELSAVVDGSGSDETKWLKIMGNPPLRKVFETAFGLPASFGVLDLDRQLETFRSKANQYFGDGRVDQFSNEDNMNELTRLFLVRSQIASNNATFSSGSIALTLLRNI